MALPFPTKVVLPFDIATAQDMNERHANDVALASGTGINNGAVTPDKRSGGFYTAQITFTAGIGSKVLTGFGFKPKMIKVQAARTNGSVITNGEGTAVDNGGSISQTFYSMTVTSTARRSIEGATATAAIADPTAGLLYAASVSSFDEDGATFNVTTDSGSAEYRKWNIVAFG